MGSLVDSDMAFTSYHQGRNQLFIPFVSTVDPGKSFPWTYFDFVLGQFDGLNYQMIPPNYKGPGTGGWSFTTTAISGGGQYIASYMNSKLSGTPHADDVILAVYSRNSITEGYELVQELTRQQILDSGTTPFSNSSNLS